MKINNIVKFIFLMVVVGMVNACTSDEETVIVPKTLEQYKQEFQAFVSSQLVVVNNCVVGYNKGDFRSSTNYDAYTSNYKAVLIAAQTVLDKPDITIADIVKANVSLAADGKNFQTNLYISDRRPLNDLIIECETLNTETLEGSALGQVSATAKADFVTAITAAKTVRNATTTIDRQVAEGVTKLNTAKQVFQDAIVK